MVSQPVLWITLIIYIGLLMLVAFYAEKSNKKGMAEYFLGGRTSGSFVIAMTWFATAYSGSTFIGFGGLIYSFGWGMIAFLVAEISAPIFQFSLYGRKIRALGEKTNSITLTDFLGHRYNSEAIRVIVALVTIIFCIPMMVVQYTSIGRLFQGTLGVNYSLAIILFATVVTIYTAVGGFRAVAWTDVIQGILMIVGMIVLCFSSLKAVGGLEGLNTKLAAKNLLLTTYPGPKNYMTLQNLISQIIIWNLAWVGQPMLNNRFLAMKDEETGKKAMVVAVLAVFVVLGLVMIPGLAAAVLIPELPAGDLAFPTLINLLLNPYIAIIFIAAVLGSAMSTTDSVLLVATSTVIRDIYQRIILARKVVSSGILEADDESKFDFVKISRLATIVIGIIVVLLSLKPVPFITLLMIFVVSGFGILSVPLTFGLYWKKATRSGAIASLVSGVIALLVIYFLNTNPMGFAPYIAAVVISATFMIVVSLFTQSEISEETVNLFFGKSNDS